MEDRYRTAYNLGCGTRHWDGWINVDLAAQYADLCCDIRNLSVVASESADAVAAIHVLEHFYEWEAFDLLTEWKRILKPGGKMILELPCMDKVFKYVVDCYTRKEPIAPFMTLYALWGDPQYKDPYMVHKYGWFVNTLTNLLAKVGMREITPCEPRYHFKMRDMRVECIK